MSLLDEATLEEEASLDDATLVELSVDDASLVPDAVPEPVPVALEPVVSSPQPATPPAHASARRIEARVHDMRASSTG